MSEKILHYEKQGQGPIVVLLHGYVSSLRYWDKLAAKLAKKNSVIAIDLLGFGDSSKPKNIAYNYDDHIGWLKKTMDQVCTNQPIILVGHSMGALLALRFATLFPQSISQLLLLNMPLFESPAQARADLKRTSSLYKANVYYGGHRIVWPLLRTSLGKKILRRHMPPALKGVEQYMFLSTALSRSGTFKHVLEDSRVLEDLKKLTGNTQLIIGTKDRPIYQKTAQKIAKKPNLEIRFIDTGHHSPLVKPEVVYRFIQSVSC